MKTKRKNSGAGLVSGMLPPSVITVWTQDHPTPLQAAAMSCVCFIMPLFCVQKRKTRKNEKYCDRKDNRKKDSDLRPGGSVDKKKTPSR